MNDSPTWANDPSYAVDPVSLIGLNVISGVCGATHWCVRLFEVFIVISHEACRAR